MTGFKIVILLVFILSLFMKPASVLSVRCIERERQALLKFKQGLIDHNNEFSSWGSGESQRECCKWSFVECSDKTDHVIGLHLLYRFGGKISPVLIELQHLNYLEFGYGENDLTVDNLEWLSHLPLLKHLSLSNVNLDKIDWVHPISKLCFLEELSLSKCQIGNTQPVFDVFVNSSFSFLSFLDLSNNNLTSFSIFPSVFNLSTRLTHVSLSYNQLDGPIPDTFGELRFLEVLDLTGNMFNRVPKTLGNLSYLSTLQMSDNALNERLPYLLQKLSGIASKSLRVIDISNNKIGGTLPDLRAYSSLQELHINGNRLERLPESIWLPTNLNTLDLSSNSLEGTVTEDHLSNSANLYALDLSYNSLALKTSSDWSPSFQLITLSLRFCNVGPDFPKWLQTQEFLSYLDMSFASISGTLPTWLWNMPSLTNLNLSYNHISGEIPHLSPNFIGISSIDLSYNNFSCPIPSFLFHSIKLQLSKNMFSGSISRLCTNFTPLNLVILDLSDNQLTGELPDCWMNSSSIQVLNLANNNFSSKIPPILGHNPQLRILHLRNNNFVGELPSSLKNCSGLRMLDVGGNKLTGIIPEWIGTHLTSLSVLSVRFNKFHGKIDPKICYLTDIQVLDLSRNNMSGEIPRCFSNFTSFVQKNSSVESNRIFQSNPSFYHSYFGIYVDNALVQWKGRELEYRKLGILKGIDLSSNKLVGTIPRQLSDLKGLVFLNLSRNHLRGNIISSIGQMEMLEWLDLSRNELYGKIPNSLAELHFLSVLDLSYNNLIGMIPLGTQLQSFNSSAYIGNSQLCGLPLAECPRDSPYLDHGHGNNIEEEDKFLSREFYICMTFGFVTGFWAVVGTLFLKHSWRHSYFNFWTNIGDWMHVTTTIYLIRLKRKNWA